MSEENKKETKPVKMEDVKAKANEKKCPVQRVLCFVEEFLAAPMCGKCFPCSMGSYEADIRLKKLIKGTATEDDINAVKEIANVMLVASLCKKGKDTARYVLENIDSKEFTEHLSGKCASNECIEYVNYLVLPEKCTMCGDCLEVCKDNAIIGEKKKTYLSGYEPFEIAQKRCTKCGECIKVCKFDAIKLITAKEMAEKETIKA